MFKGKNIFIAGGTGSWGQELVKQLLPMQPNRIVIYSRGELAQVNMQRAFNNNILQFIIGDVRDEKAVLRATERVDIIFNLAALKHVPVCENQPQEAIKTNIEGTINLINASVVNHAKKFILVSTDKAVSPTNLYGMTKAVCEKLVIQANCMTKDTDFVCIRGGNVLGSNGSVVPFFINSIKKQNSVTVTDKLMTRFFLTLEEAIGLLFKAVIQSRGGEIFVMNMPSFRIVDLAEILIEYYGDSLTKIKVTGIREGEKINEILISEHESRNTYVVDNDYFVILPSINVNREYDVNEKVSFSQFSTENNIKDRLCLVKMLNNGGFLPCLK